MVYRIVFYHPDAELERGYVHSGVAGIRMRESRLAAWNTPSTVIKGGKAELGSGQS